MAITKQLKRPLVVETKQLTANGIITSSIAPYGTIDDIFLTFKNNGAPAAKADILKAITKIALNVNGEQFVNAPLAMIEKVKQSLGGEITQIADSNVFGLNIGRLMFQNPTEEDFFALGCSNIQTIQVQVYCGNAITGVTDVEISTERRAVELPLGSFIKILNYPQNLAEAGTSTVDNLPRDSNEAYLSILADANGGTISTGEVSVNGTNVYDPMTQDLNDAIVAYRRYGPVAGVFNYLFADRSNRGLLPMMGVTDLRLKTAFSAAPTSGTYNLTTVSIKNVPSLMTTRADANA